MLQIGDMVRRYGAGPVMKIGDIIGEEAACVWFDGFGRIHVREFYLDALDPFWLSSAARSLWPDVNQMPEKVAEELEAKAAAKRRERFRRPRPSAVKALKKKLKQ